MIMPNNLPVAVLTPARPPKPPKKRIRLSDRQKALLDAVFLDGRTLITARDELRITPPTLCRWLQKPVFTRAVEMYLSHCRMQIRITAAVQAPRSIDSMAIFMNSNNRQYVRWACEDLIETCRTFYSIDPGQTELSSNDYLTTNDYAKENDMKTQPVSQKLKRLTRRQKDFLTDVMEIGRPIEHVMEDCHITPRMIHAWLRQPRFQQAVECRMAQFRLQARIEAARSLSHAVQSLSEVVSKGMNHEVIRKASMDLLKIHHTFENPRGSRQAAQKCSSTEKRKENRAQKCTPKSQNGTKMRADVRGGISPMAKKLVFIRKPQKTSGFDSFNHLKMLPPGVPLLDSRQSGPASHPDILRRPDRVECE